MPTVENILQILDSSDNDAKVKVLQAFLKKPEAATDHDILKKVEILCRDMETSVRFWARKLYTKIGELLSPAEEKAAILDTGFRRYDDKIPVRHSGESRNPGFGK